MKFTNLRIFFKKIISTTLMFSTLIFLTSFSNNVSTNQDLNFNINYNIQTISQTNNGLTADVYSVSAGSSPNLDNKTLRLSTTVLNINYDWSSGAILDSGYFNNVAVIFTGYITPQFTGQTYFYADADDGVRIYLNDQLFYDNWVDKGGGGKILPFTTTQGIPLKFKLEYYENGGGAKVILNWNFGTDSLAGMVVVPESAFNINNPFRTVSFNTNGGESISPLSGAPGTPLTLPTNVSKTGHTFLSWHTNINLSSESIYSTSVYPESDITLYAEWQLNKYNINIRGFDNSILASQEVNYNAVPTLSFPSAPVKQGYDFYGWSNQIPSIMPAQEINIYALYKTAFVEQNFTIGNVDKNYVGGSVTFAIDTNDPFSYYVFNNDNQQMTALGTISRFGNNIYYGDGTSAIKFAEVDNQENGINGQDLKINFTNSLDSAGQLITNGNFNTLESWTSFPQKFPQLVDGEFKNNTNPTYFISILQGYLELKISAEFRNSNSVAHGPYIESPSFSGIIGEVISFDYWADSPFGDYDIYVYLKDISNNTTTQILYETGDQILSSSKKLFRYELNVNSSELRLIFVGGGAISGSGENKKIESSFYIDNVSKSQGVKSSEIVNSLINSISLISSRQNLKFTTITTQDSENLVTVYSSILENNVDQLQTVTINDINLNYSFIQDQSININLDFKNYFSNKAAPIKYYITNANASNDFISINVDTGVISGTGLNANVGLNEINVLARQTITNNENVTTEYYSDTLPFKINIINVNDPITYNTEYGETHFVEVSNLASFSYQIPSNFFLDIDVNDTKTYSFEGVAPVCLEITNGGLITGTSCTSSNISSAFIVKVIDSGGSTATGQIKFVSGVVVTFNSLGGTAIGSQVLNSGSLATEPTQPVKVNYNFDGWYINTSFENLSNKFNFSTIPTTMTLYAYWIPEPYNINYFLNGGTNNEFNPATYTVETSTFNLGIASKNGYTFSGWYESDDFNGTPITEIVFGSSGSINLYARWIPTPYTISYILNNGTNNPANFTTYNIETDTFELLSPSRIGYNFLGWYDNIQLQGTAVRNVVIGGFINRNFYASWSPIVYQINYLDMLTSIGSNPLTYTIESNNITLQTNFSQTGFNFLGFYDNPAFSGTPITSIPAGSIGEKNLYANWIKASFNLTFKDDKGGTLSTQSVEFGTTIDTSFFPATDKPGFDFIGWGATLPSVMPAANVEVIAQFKAKQFKLTIKDSLGNIIADEILDFDSPLDGINLPEVEVDGFEFEGWEPSLPAKMPAADLEIVGVYRELPKFKIIVYGTKDEIIAEFEYRELAEVSSINLPDLSGSNDFIFEGWDAEVPSTMPGNNVEIRPLGTKRESSLNLYSADRTLIDIIQAQIGTSLDIPTPSRLGFNFAGWTDASGSAKNISVMPETEDSLFASWQPKIYSILVTVGSNDFNINVTFGEPIGNIVSPQLFGFRFEGWKNNLTGEFLNSNTIFISPEQINLVPVYTRLNAGETLIAATRLISDFIISIFR